MTVIRTRVYSFFHLEGWKGVMLTPTPSSSLLFRLLWDSWRATETTQAGQKAGRGEGSKEMATATASNGNGLRPTEAVAVAATGCVSIVIVFVSVACFVACDVNKVSDLT